VLLLVVLVLVLLVVALVVVLALVLLVLALVLTLALAVVVGYYCTRSSSYLQLPPDYDHARPLGSRSGSSTTTAEYTSRSCANIFIRCKYSHVNHQIIIGI